MKPFYCAKAGRRIKCGALSVCPKDRQSCEIYRAVLPKTDASQEPEPRKNIPENQKNKTSPECKKQGAKVCSLCKEKKPLSEFYKKKKTPDGLECWCKECFKKKQKEYKAKRKKQKQEKVAQAPAPAPDPPAGDPDPAPVKKAPENDPPAGDPDPVQEEANARHMHALAEEMMAQRKAMADPLEKTETAADMESRLVLDFSGHKELFDRLKEAAEEDLRPLDMEVLYLIKKVFERADKRVVVAGNPDEGFSVTATSDQADTFTQCAGPVGA